VTCQAQLDNYESEGSLGVDFLALYKKRAHALLTNVLLLKKEQDSGLKPRILFIMPSIKQEPISN